MATNPVISKIKLANGTVVDLKDAAGRADLATLLGEHAVAALGAAAWLGVDESLADNGTGVATSGVIKSYVDSQVGAINKFDVVVAEAKGGSGSDKNDPATAASASTMYQLTLVQDANAEAGTYIEFITVRSGAGTDASPYTYVWEKIGSTKADLTGYVEKTQKIAGIDLADDITDSELKTALGLGALAYKASASGSTSLSTVDSITMQKLTVAGNATVTTTDTAATLTKADYTPAGTVSGKVTATGTVDVTLADASSKTEADITYASYTPAGTVAATSGGDFQALKTATFGEVSASTSGAVQVEGTVAAPTITLTPSTVNVITGVSAAATLPTFSEGAFTAATWTGSSYTAPTWTGSSYTAPTLGSATTSAFATDGIVATVNTSASASDADYECLVFTAASTNSAVTAQGTFSAGSLAFGTFGAGSLDFGTFAGGSKAADTFTAGSAATFSTADVLTSATTASAAAPAFTGKYYANAVTADTALKTVAFTGTAADIKASKVEYVKPVVSSATFTGTEASITAAFTGSTAASILTTGVSYKAADASAAFSVDVTPEVSAITSTSKSINITVS